MLHSSALDNIVNYANYSPNLPDTVDFGRGFGQGADASVYATGLQGCDEVKKVDDVAPELVQDPSSHVIVASPREGVSVTDQPVRAKN